MYYSCFQYPLLLPKFCKLALTQTSGTSNYINPAGDFLNHSKQTKCSDTNSSENIQQRHLEKGTKVKMWVIVPICKWFLSFWANVWSISINIYQNMVFIADLQRSSVYWGAGCSCAFLHTVSTRFSTSCHDTAHHFCSSRTSTI